MIRYLSKFEISPTAYSSKYQSKVKVYDSLFSNSLMKRICKSNESRKFHTTLKFRPFESNKNRRAFLQRNFNFCSLRSFQRISWKERKCFHSLMFIFWDLQWINSRFVIKSWWVWRSFTSMRRPKEGRVLCERDKRNHCWELWGLLRDPKNRRIQSSLCSYIYESLVFMISYYFQTIHLKHP